MPNFTQLEIASGIYDVKDLEARNNIDILKTKNILMFGDSLFDGYTPDSTIRQGWGYWAKYFLTKYGYTVYNSSDITDNNYGSAFAGQKTYVQHLNKTLSDYPNLRNINISEVIVYTGTNDLNNSIEDTKQGIINFEQAIHNIWPKAIIRIGYFSIIHNNKAYQLNELFRNCAELGCFYIENSYYLCCNKSYLSSDGIHLSTDGYSFYSRYLYQGAIYGMLNYTFKFPGIKIKFPEQYKNFVGDIENKIELIVIIKNDNMFIGLEPVGGAYTTITSSTSGANNPTFFKSNVIESNLSISFPNAILAQEPYYHPTTGEIKGYYKMYIEKNNTITVVLIGLGLSDMKINLSITSLISTTQR